MGKSTRETQSRRASSNVVSLHQDAESYFERGLRYLQRNNLPKALKAFRKTVEVEPNNPVNHCNLAGVLAEMGNFEESNEVLIHILQDLDPDMTECQFYLANNYANMGQYEAAEEYVLQYLDSDPDGEYAEDAVEMLDVLMDEFGGGQAYQRWEQKKQQEEQDAAKRDGRELLEQGQFEAAVELLEKIALEEPPNTAAKNNLSLAYYYTGQNEKAMETAESVLRDQADNIHALCNMTVFLKHGRSKELLDACVERLTKVFPLHYDLAMKVATTLGLVGRHQEAYQIFSRLVGFVDEPEPGLIHSIAAAAANMGSFSMARKWWRILRHTGNSEVIADYYLALLERIILEGKDSFYVSYQYDVPLQTQFSDMKTRLLQTDVEEWGSDPLLRASLYWGLRNGNSETRRIVIRTLALIGDDDAKKALCGYVERQDVDEATRIYAITALFKMGIRGKISCFMDGELKHVRITDVISSRVLNVDPFFEEVLERVTGWLQGHQLSDFIRPAVRLWQGYQQELLLSAPKRIGKSDIWAAGVLYVTLRYHGIAITQKELADHFHVATSSLRKASVKLEAVLLRSGEEV